VCDRNSPNQAKEEAKELRQKERCPFGRYAIPAGGKVERRVGIRQQRAVWWA